MQYGEHSQDAVHEHDAGHVFLFLLTSNTNKNPKVAIKSKSRDQIHKNGCWFDPGVFEIR